METEPEDGARTARSPRASPKPEIVKHIIALKKWRLVEQIGMKGRSPQYMAVARKGDREEREVS